MGIGGPGVRQDPDRQASLECVGELRAGGGGVGGPGARPGRGREVTLSVLHWLQDAGAPYFIYLSFFLVKIYWGENC